MSERVLYHDANFVPCEGTMCTKAEGKTRQSDADAADINKIVARFDFSALAAEFEARRQLGEAPWLGVDVSSIPDFQTAVNYVRDMEEYFMRLPADIRAKFGNKPEGLIDAYGKEEYASVFREMGVLPEDPGVVADRAEAAVESRAAARARARAEAAAVEAAKAALPRG